MPTPPRSAAASGGRPTAGAMMATSSIAWSIGPLESKQTNISTVSGRSNGTRSDSRGTISNRVQNKTAIWLTARRVCHLLGQQLELKQLTFSRLMRQCLLFLALSCQLMLVASSSPVAVSSGLPQAQSDSFNQPPALDSRSIISQTSPDRLVTWALTLAPQKLKTKGQPRRTLEDEDTDKTELAWRPIRKSVSSRHARRSPVLVGVEDEGNWVSDNVSLDSSVVDERDLEAATSSSADPNNDLTQPSSDIIEQSDGSSALDGSLIDSQLANVTCSPDYDDQALIVASGNLTAEQQQQLLAGVDLSGLLPATSNNNNANSNTNLQSLSQEQLLRIRQSQLMHQNQCMQSGSRMIEFITRVITPILFSIIIVVGLVGNIVVMLVILEDRKTDRELTPTNLLILDLSLADLSFIIFCIPFTGWDYAVGHWVFGSFWCKANQYLIVVCALSSIYTLVLMSIDRFLAIVYPLECMSYRTSKNMLYAICIKWILILLTASPTIPMHGLIDSPFELDQFNCRLLSDQYNPLQFQIVFFITSYLFPLILILCLYLSLIIKLWFGTKPRGHKESSKMLESKKKVTWLVAGIVILFALCWCPIQVMLILMRLKSYKITATYIAIQVCSHILGYMNSCVNPIVYAFASETFLNSFKRSSFGRFCYNLCICFKGSNDINGNSYLQHNQDNNQILHLHHRQSQHDLEARPISSTAAKSSTEFQLHSASGLGGHNKGPRASLAACRTYGGLLAPTYESANNSNLNNTNTNNSPLPLSHHSNESGRGHQQVQLTGSSGAVLLSHKRHHPDLNVESKPVANVRSPATTLLMTPQHNSGVNIGADAPGSSYNVATNSMNPDPVSRISGGPLPLEPRDRPQPPPMRSPSLALSSNLHDIYTSSKTVAGPTKLNQLHDIDGPPTPPSLSQPNSTDCFRPPGDDRACECKSPPAMKQKLVARVNSTTGSSQVSHRCEPCYQ